ncbi:MAG TPA: FHA domain-containing protein [Blastocatellia bacterium]|nr:FHA domain-containing protein [Blastocatellia bacterium]
MIGQEHDCTRSHESTVAVSIGKGRATSNIPASQIRLSFIGGLCAGRTGFFLNQTITSIGRDEECEIVLDGNTVSRRHCEIACQGATCILRDSSRNGTFVNGERVRQAQLRDGDQIRIGGNVLLVNFSSGIATGALSGKMTASNRPSSDIELKPQIVVKGLEESVTQTFGEDRITIGRRADNHIAIDEDNISRLHVSIERRGGQYFIRDLGSANGTYLNERRTDIAQLADGDRLRIGGYLIAVSLVEQDCILNFKKIT